MGRREAPSALRGRGRIRQFDPGRLMPALRVGERQEGRSCTSQEKVDKEL